MRFIMRSGNCYFSSISSCSDKPIRIAVATESLCEVVTTFDLPQEYGNPYTKFVSCKENPCTETEYAAGELISVPTGDNQFVKFVNPTKASYYEIELRGDACLGEICVLGFNDSELENCNVTQFLNRGATVYERENTFSTAILIAAITSFVLLLVALLVISYKSKKNNLICFKRNTKRPIKDDSIAVELKRLPRIFMVFSDDHPLHREVVLKFAAVLEADFGFQVILDLYDRENLYLDPTAWLEQSSMAGKILVIWSPGFRTREESKSNIYDMFLPVLKQVKQDLRFGKDTAKYLFVKFEYISENPSAEQLFQTIPCFDLPFQFDNLLKNLAGDKHWKWKSLLKKSSTRQYLDASDYGKAFNCSLSEMHSVAADNSNWYCTTTAALRYAKRTNMI